MGDSSHVNDECERSSVARAGRIDMFRLVLKAGEFGISSVD